MRLREARETVQAALTERTFLVGDRVLVVGGEYRGRTGRIRGNDWELPLYGLHAPEGERGLPVELEPEPSRVSGIEPDWSGRREKVLIRDGWLRRWGEKMPTGTARR